MGSPLFSVKEGIMTRTIQVISTLVFGGMLMGSIGCEDKVCQESLVKANAASAESAKLVSDKNIEIAALKEKLEASERALAAAKQETAKPEDAEEAKAVKPEKQTKGKKKAKSKAKRKKRR
jgi:hypothetical protein